MTFRIDEPNAEAISGREIGPGGVLIAEIGHDFAAEVDVADGFVVRVTDLALGSSGARRQALHDLVHSEVALDAVRRIVSSTVILLDEPHDDPRWCVLDRVLARLDLAGAVPAMEVSDTDVEVAEAVAALRSDSLEISRARALGVQALVDTIRRRSGALDGLPSTGELVEAHLAGLALSLGLERSVGAGADQPPGVPRVILLSAGPDLAHAMSNAPARLDRTGQLDISLVLPVAASYRSEQFGRLACYLVEPLHEHPIAHVSLLTEQVGEDGERALVGHFRITAEQDLSAFEFVVLPAGTADQRIVSPSVARSLLCAEIRLRTAIRLAQRSRRPEALASLDESERAYRSVRRHVPAHYWDRLHEIRRRIEDDDYPSDLLSDL